MALYRKPDYTDDELAVRLWDMEEVKDLLARRAYYLSDDRRHDELADLWVTKAENKRTASLGSNWGYYVGMKSIEEHYCRAHTELQYERLKAYNEADPEIAVNNVNLGRGFSCSHTVNTGHVVIAYDGKTARGLFYDVSQQTVGKPGGTADTDVVIGPVAVDFMKEDGEWKIWHLFYGADHIFRVGEDYGEVPIPRPVEQNPVAQEFGTPDIPMITYDPDYGWADHYPAMPDPYDTFSDATSYGPEGHPKFVKEVIL